MGSGGSAHIVVRRRFGRMRGIVGRTSRIPQAASGLRFALTCSADGNQQRIETLALIALALVLAMQRVALS